MPNLFKLDEENHIVFLVTNEVNNKNILIEKVVKNMNCLQQGSSNFSGHGPPFVNLLFTRTPNTKQKNN